MKKVWLIIEREYITRVRKKSFIITTLLAPLGFAAFFGIVIFLAKYQQTDRRIAVVDKSGMFEHQLQDRSNIHFFFETMPFDTLQYAYKALEYDGILYIPDKVNLTNPRGITYYSDAQLGIVAEQHIEKQIVKVIKKKKIEEEHLDEKTLDRIDNIDLEVTYDIRDENGEKTVDSAVAAAMGYLMGFAIYTILLVYGTMVMKSVAEEKTNKIVEVVISSVKPFQLMLGKIIGVGAVGITQFILWGILISIVYASFGFMFHDQLQNLQSMSSGPGMSAEQQEEVVGQILTAWDAFQQLPLLSIFLQFVFYFFGGYMLYGALFAALGSATGDEGENQSLSVIVSIPIIISIIIMTTVVQDPNSTLAKFSSIFPFSSPIVMPARLAFQPAIWERLLSMALLVVGFLFTTWLAGRIYRVGILLYGKKVSLKDLAKWVRG